MVYCAIKLGWLGLLRFKVHGLEEYRHVTIKDRLSTYNWSEMTREQVKDRLPSILSEFTISDIQIL